MATFCEITSTIGKLKMNHDELLAFMRREPYAVQASVSEIGEPQAALVGIIVSGRFELFFDTLATSRKAINLRQNPRVAFVVGPAQSSVEQTVQYEGIADEPTGSELEILLDLYYARFPAGRSRRELPGITYFRVKPKWIQYSNYGVDPPQVVKLGEQELTR